MSVLEHTLFAIGLSIISVGIFVTIVAAMLGSSKFQGKWAVVGFIGPFPFGTGSDKDFLKFVTIISIIIFIFFLLLSKRVFI